MLTEKGNCLLGIIEASGSCEIEDLEGYCDPIIWLDDTPYHCSALLDALGRDILEVMVEDAGGVLECGIFN